MKALSPFLFLSVFILLFGGSVSLLCQEFVLKDPVNELDWNIATFKEFLVNPEHALDFPGLRAVWCVIDASDYSIETSLLTIERVNIDSFISHPALKPKYKNLEVYAELLVDALDTSHYRLMPPGFVYVLLDQEAKDWIKSLYQDFGFVPIDPSAQDSVLQVYSRYQGFMSVPTHLNAQFSVLQLLCRIYPIDENDKARKDIDKKMQEMAEKRQRGLKRKRGEADEDYGKRKSKIKINSDRRENGVACYRPRTAQMIGFSIYHKYDTPDADKIIIDYVYLDVADESEKEPILLQMLQHLSYKWDNTRTYKKLVIEISVEYIWPEERDFTMKGDMRDPVIIKVFEKCGFSKETIPELIKKHVKTGVKTGRPNQDQVCTFYPYRRRVFENGEPLFGGNYCNYRYSR